MKSTRAMCTASSTSLAENGTRFRFSCRGIRTMWWTACRRAKRRKALRNSLRLQWNRLFRRHMQSLMGERSCINRASRRRSLTKSKSVRGTCPLPEVCNLENSLIAFELGLDRDICLCVTLKSGCLLVMKSRSDFDVVSAASSRPSHLAGGLQSAILLC